MFHLRLRLFSMEVECGGGDGEQQQPWMRTSGGSGRCVRKKLLLEWVMLRMTKEKELLDLTRWIHLVNGRLLARAAARYLDEMPKLFLPSLVNGKELIIFARRFMLGNHPPLLLNQTATWMLMAFVQRTKKTISSLLAGKTSGGR